MSAAAFPSLSEVMAWDSAYLDEAVTHWNNAANVWEDAYSQTYREAQHPGGTEWIGLAADAAVEKVGGDRLAVVGAADTLCEAARNAQSGSSRLSFARQRLLDVVAEAEDAGFEVGEDYSVTKLPRVRGVPLPGAPQFVPVPGVTAGHEPPVIGSLGQEPDLPETGVEP